MEMIEREFTHKSLGILLTRKGKKLTDYAKSGPEPLYKIVPEIKNIHMNRKFKTGQYVSLFTLRRSNPNIFPGIEILTESIQGELVVGYRETESEIAKQTVQNLPRLIKYIYIEAEQEIC